MEETFKDIARWEIVPLSSYEKEGVVTYFDTTRTVVIRDKLTGVVLEVWNAQPYPFFKGVQLFISVEQLVRSLQAGIGNGAIFELGEFYKEKQ